MAAGQLRPRLPRDAVERRLFVEAPPAAVWSALGARAAHDGASLRLGDAGPDWPAVGADRAARLPVGPIRLVARVVSLEARPGRRLRLGVRARAVAGEWSWELEPAHGGTRVACAARVEGLGRVGSLLARLERRDLGTRLEADLAALKAASEAARGDVPHSTRAGARAGPDTGR